MNVFELINERINREIQLIAHCIPSEKVRYTIEGCERAIEAVDEVEKEYNNGWIPCSERLPKFNEYVLCSVNDKYADHNIIISKFKDEVYWHNGRIVAWQPLPAPYKEGGMQ